MQHDFVFYGANVCLALYRYPQWDTPKSTNWNGREMCKFYLIVLSIHNAPFKNQGATPENADCGGRKKCKFHQIVLYIHSFLLKINLRIRIELCWPYTILKFKLRLQLMSFFSSLHSKPQPFLAFSGHLVHPPRNRITNFYPCLTHSEGRFPLRSTNYLSPLS